jgi:hypothetical protein
LHLEDVMNSRENDPVARTAVNPATAPAAAATRTNAPTVAFIETQFGELVASAAAQATGVHAATPAPGGVKDFDAPLGAGWRRA